MKFKAAFLACTLACGSVMADSGLPNPASKGQPIEINGQSFHKIVPKSRSIYTAINSSYKGVYPGDKLMDPAGLNDFTVTGTIFVRTSDSDARQLADKYGLNIIFSTESITSFQTKEGTELTRLIKQLKNNGKQVQLELVNQNTQPM